MKARTISEAAEEASSSLGKPSTVEELYAEIIRLNLYKFNTPNPLHVLDTELKRNISEGPRNDIRTYPKFRIDTQKKIHNGHERDIHYATKKSIDFNEANPESLGQGRIN